MHFWRVTPFPVTWEKTCSRLRSISSISLGTFLGGLKPALLSWVELHFRKVFSLLIIFLKVYFAIILPAASAVVLQPRRYHQEKLRCLPIVPAVPTQLRGPLLWRSSSLSCYFRLHNTVWTEINHQLCRLLFHQTIFLPSRTVPRLSWLLGVAPERRTQRASCLAWEGLEWPHVVLVMKVKEKKEKRKNFFFFLRNCQEKKLAGTVLLCLGVRYHNL